MLPGADFPCDVALNISGLPLVQWLPQSPAIIQTYVNAKSQVTVVSWCIVQYVKKKHSRRRKLSLNRNMLVFVDRRVFDQKPPVRPLSGCSSRGTLSSSREIYHVYCWMGPRPEAWQTLRIEESFVHYFMSMPGDPACQGYFLLDRCIAPEIESRHFYRLTKERFPRVFTSITSAVLGVWQKRPLKECEVDHTVHVLLCTGSRSVALGGLAVPHSAGRVKPPETANPCTDAWYDVRPYLYKMSPDTLQDALRGE